MNWVQEKEEWLVDWSDARCVEEIAFDCEGSGALQLYSQDPSDVFFSEVIETESRCFLCRASRSIVDVFDISPWAERLLSWRIRLPSPIVEDIGLSHICDANAASLCIFFLTKACTVHRVHVELRGTEAPRLTANGSTSGNSWPSLPSSFAALGRDLTVVGCFGGSLHTVAIGSPHLSTYEFTDAPLMKRILGGFSQPVPSSTVLALAAAGSNRGRDFSPGYRFLSFSADGQLRLWEALERHGRLLGATALPGSSCASEQALGIVGSASTYMRVWVSGARVKFCLVLRNSVYVMDLVEGAASLDSKSFSCREIEAPFPGAAPSLVALSRGILWSFWSSVSREQLFRLDLEDRDVTAWRQEAVESSQVGPTEPELRTFVTEGCLPAVGHSIVFSQQHQHEVWRVEEDGFEALRVKEALSSDEAEPLCPLEELVLRWWLSRIFLPGRYSLAAIAAALGSPQPYHGGDLRVAVEEHLRRHAGGYPPAQDSEDAKDLHLAGRIAAVAQEFLSACDAVWRRKKQVCGLSVSRLWGEAAWGTERGPGEFVCPLLLCHGGLSCIRPVHSWPERWWATLHLSRDLSNYEKIEIDDVMEVSALPGWKLCGTAWFLSQAVCNSSLEVSICGSIGGRSAAASLLGFVRELPESLATHVAKCAQSALSSSASPRDLEMLQKALFASFAGGSEVQCRGNKEWSDHPVRLSDILRGSVALSEAVYAAAAVRDLLQLCLYLNSAPTLTAVPADTWLQFSRLLETQLPSLLALQDFAALEVRQPNRPFAFPVRLCDLWAMNFRIPGGESCPCSLRVPIASFRSLSFAELLIRVAAWPALQGWSRCEGTREIAAYMAGREWAATRHPAAACEAFLSAEAAASQLLGRPGGLPSAERLVTTGLPLLVSYYEHIAALFRLHGSSEEEMLFLQKAAALSESFDGQASGAPALRDERQRLWRLVFEQALGLDLYPKAVEALLRLEVFELQLRALSQKLRGCGKLHLMLKMPEPHRAIFLSSLHEQASLGLPLPGSDSLSCYQHLFALYFSDRKFLKAASVAFALFSALGRCLQHFQDSSADGASGRTLLTGGDCISDPSAVPSKAGPPRSKPATPPSDLCVRAADVWPILDKQRAALLMLASALSLTEEKMLLAPASSPSDRSRSSDASTMPSALSPDVKVLRPWFAEAASQIERKTQVVTLQQAQQLLSVVEAQLILSGDTRMTPSLGEAAAVARLGLLGLSLQVAAAIGLDAWEHALQPFLGLILKAEQDRQDDARDEKKDMDCGLEDSGGSKASGGKKQRQKMSKVQELLALAQGPAMAYMFRSSDGSQPLGTGGCIVTALWQMLEDGIARVTGSRGGLTAQHARLYALVADEVLQARPQVQLPSFILTLSTGPFWVTLLRLYMKHRKLEEAVLLLEELLRKSSSKRPATALETSPWDPLLDFPVQLLVQLRRSLAAQSKREPSGPATKLGESLDTMLEQFAGLLEEQPGSDNS